MTKPIFFSAVIAMFLLLGMSCRRVADPCLQSTNVTVAIGTYKPATDTSTQGLDSILPKAYVGYVANGWINNYGSKTNKFYLRLSAHSDTCKWFISPDSTMTALDTITIIYSRQLNFISRSCGYAYHYFINDVKWTFNRIDSVKIKNNAVTGTAGVENVKIFY
jgi:hypothetical protein